VILEAQTSVFSANEERATLVQRVSDLEEEVARLEAWNAEKKRYQLVETVPGVMAYTLRQRMLL
jgi:hypothetical protein